MCRRQIPSSVWRSGHREQCAVKNKRILEAMPVPESCKVGSSNHPPSQSSQMSKKYFRCNVQKKYSQTSKKYSQVRCPKCRSRLRVWPENHGPPFTCSSSTCPVVGRLRSTGANRFEIRETTENHLLFRFTCFLCNFDLCESCLTRKLGRSLLNPEPSRTPARETSSSCSRGRESWCFGPTAANNGPMDPSAPLLPVHEEQPPSYQEAIRDRE